jgi:hypothetical protein
MAEGGALNPPAAIAKVVTDALSPFGVSINQTLIVPELIRILMIYWRSAFEQAYQGP